MHMTLKLIEYDAYVTMGYQICLDLRSEYEAAKVQTGIDYALFARHFSVAYCLRMMLDCVVNKPITRQPIPFPVMNTLPDELEETKDFIRVLTWVNSLYEEPFVDMLVVCPGYFFVCFSLILIRLQCIGANTSYLNREYMYHEL
jgi:hypothetical protein